MKKAFYISVIFSVSLSIAVDAQTQSKSQLNGTIAYVQGLEAFENQEYERSVELLIEAEKQLGGTAGVNYAIADAYFVMEDLPSAALYGKRAVELAPKNKWYRFKLAQIYRSAGENTATLEELNTLLEFYPNDYDALFMLADTYKDYGEYLKSNQILDRAFLYKKKKCQYFLVYF